MEDEQKVEDQVEATVEPATGAPARNKYRVIVETGIFKNGKEYAPGEIVELDPSTAERFKALGEIEDAE